jgi:hypothetical protein
MILHGAVTWRGSLVYCVLHVGADDDDMVQSIGDGEAGGVRIEH